MVFVFKNNNINNIKYIIILKVTKMTNIFFNIYLRKYNKLVKSLIQRMDFLGCGNIKIKNEQRSRVLKSVLINIKHTERKASCCVFK